jgi:sulfate adenylyltransferase subunit 1
MSVTLTLEDEIDISRGDVLVHSNNQAEVASDLEVYVIWMAEQAMTPNKQ